MKAKPGQVQQTSGSVRETTHSRAKTSASLDSSGAGPRLGDHDAVESMRNLLNAMPTHIYRTASNENGLYYPSTVRTTLLPGLAGPWWYVCLYHRHFPREGSSLSSMGKWFNALNEFLDEQTYWIGIHEIGPSEVTARIFLAPRQRVKPATLWAGLLAHAPYPDVTFSYRDYDRQNGPLPHLTGLRYPCGRLGLTFSDKLERVTPPTGRTQQD